MLESIAVVVHLKDVHVVGEPVEKRSRYLRVAKQACQYRAFQMKYLCSHTFLMETQLVINNGNQDILESDPNT